MATKSSSQDANQPLPRLLVSKEDAEAKIADRIEKGEELHDRQVHDWEGLRAARRDYDRWSDYNDELLKRLFTNESLAREYSQPVPIASFWGSRNFTTYVNDFYKDINRKINRLGSIKERLELIPLANPVDPKSEVNPETGRSTEKVFVVHGHDGEARETVARFLEKLGLQAIILHEQTSGGRTIIEKLERYSDVGFAVVLLTPDDVGASASSGDNLTPRARQNVILELGYFIGKLGRERVCALHKSSIELPSDMLGVVYVPMEGDWRLQVAKELHEVGFEVDLNKAVWA